MSFGSAMGAIVSLKNNRRPRKARVETFVKTTGSGIGKIEDYKKISAEEREILRQRILREQRKKKNRKVLFITMIIMMLLGSLFFYFMF